jgi:phosphoglycolate phosphatase-like HAD superfamily hydrolase
VSDTPSEPVSVILWDIDGTLLSTGGAGREALDIAFEELFGVPQAFVAVSFGGRTDLGLIGEAFERAGLPMPEDAAPRLHDRYVGHLRRLLADRPGRAKLLPGLPVALAQTAPRAVNALLTGNWRAGAAAKLGAVGLWESFRFGAFADDAADRNALVPIARRRAQAHGVTPGRVIVIGDTPHDVACARAGGAVAVAVCTGWSSREELVACGPDLLIEDLVSGLDAFLELL